jgi:hypothetical protein
MTSLSRTLFLDAGPLLLLVVGWTDRRLIQKHKRTRSFTVDDFDSLDEVVSGYSRVSTTPNVLTEVNNLLDHHAEPERGRLFETFRSVIERMSEVYRPSADACLIPEFDRLGLTDAVLLLETDRPVFITSDGPLSEALGRRGFEVELFPPKRTHNSLGG